MSKTRTQKRQTSPGIQLLNKLFFDFTAYFEANHQVIHGMVHVDPLVWRRLQNLDDHWRKFCHNFSLNPKTRYQFNIGQLTCQAEKHIDLIFFKEFINYINHYMNTIEIPEINFKVQMPSEFEEMNEAQFLFFAGEMSKLIFSQQNLEDFKTNMVYKFLDIKHNRKKYNSLSEFTKIEISENVYLVSELLDYFFILEEDKVKINLSWTKNFIRKITPFLIPYYGPADAIQNLTFREYKDAHHFYTQYVKSYEESHLNDLCAVLYRSKFFFYRPKYKSSSVARRSKRFAKLPLATRFGIFLFFSACEEFLHNGTFKSDGNEINLKILYEQTFKESMLDKKIKYKSELGLIGLAYSFAKTGVFGTVEDVLDQNIYDILLMLYQSRIEYLNQLENTEVK